MKKPIPLALALLAASPACALQHPEPAVALNRGGDPHVQVAIYNPTTPVLLVGAVGRPVTITFGSTESIKRVVLETTGVADGKSVVAPWEGPDAQNLSDQPLGNTLPLWAMRAGRSSAQVITTIPETGDRVYAFQLIALPSQPDDCRTDDCDDPRLASALSFVYPDERRAAQAQVTQAKAQIAGKQEASDRVKQDLWYGPRNWKYTAKGKPEAVKHLAPDEVSDNTQATGFLYLGNRAVPAFYIVEPGDIEREVQPSPVKDLLVQYDTAPHWRLRRGTEVIDLYNKGYDPIGVNPWTGTTSPSVVRVLKNVSVQHR